MATCRTPPTNLPDQLQKGHIFPAFNNSLVRIGPLCDADFKVLFYKETVNTFDPSGYTILAGCHGIHGTVLRLFYLRHEVDKLPPSPPSATTTILGAFSAYDLPSVEALFRYFHASSGLLVKSTWI